MSSIAYVTDRQMLEYHRLCVNRSMLFWRLTVKNKFTDFKKDDLLFFYAKGNTSRKKGFIGYGHYDSTKKLSLNSMWDKYGTLTGYDTKEQLTAAISKAAKGDIPKSMQCLYLTDIVFFVAPVWPKEVGLNIPDTLESYCYIDKNDPQVTARILQKAEKLGIDLWSFNEDMRPEDIFHRDESRHMIALAGSMLGKDSSNAKELAQCRKLAKAKSEKEGWEKVRGSSTDLFKFEKDSIHIAVPFASQVNDRAKRIQELFGKMSLYRLYLKQNGLKDRIFFEVLSESEDKEIENLVKLLNE